MANFRIKVEALNDNVQVNEKLANGIEVKGYVLMGDIDGERGILNIGKMSIVDIAQCINGNKDIIHAARVSDVLVNGDNHKPQNVARMIFDMMNKTEAE